MICVIHILAVERLRIHQSADKLVRNKQHQSSDTQPAVIHHRIAKKTPNESELKTFCMHQHRMTDEIYTRAIHLFYKF